MYMRRLALAIVIIATLIIADRCAFCIGNSIALNVKHKFAGKQKNLSAIKAHDIRRRRARFLSTVNVDIPLGGNGNLGKYGVYYATIEIGNPPQDYHVLLDTGIDFSWLDGVHCEKCAKKSYLGIKLNKYDPDKSNTSSLISCDDEFCSAVNPDKLLVCDSDEPCKYNSTYPDNARSTGHLVKDIIQLRQATKNLHNEIITNGSFVFGCGMTRKYGISDTDEGDVDGVLGFGPGILSAISQLAASGKVKRQFSHCLNEMHGGGIFAIGEVEQPQMNKTSMIKNEYKIHLMEMEIGNVSITLSRKGVGVGVDIDMGSNLAYLPTKIHRQVIKTITHRPSVMPKIVNNFTCFAYDKDVDKEFPAMKLNFADSLVLTVYPRDYLFTNEDGMQCIIWSRSEDNDEGAHILLGDMMLTNKLVTYDIENQTIGWTDFNCSSDIIMKDENANVNDTVGSHDVNSASSISIVEFLILLPVLIILLHFSLA